MVEVALSVAVITAATGIVGASVPQAMGLLSEARRDARARNERTARDLRRACVGLLTAAGELRSRVAAAAHVHGEEMSTRLAEIRAAAVAVQEHALSVALTPPARLGDNAQKLADVAARLAVATAADTEKVAHQMLHPPDFADLDAAMVAFRKAAVADAKGMAAEPRA